MRSIRTKLIFWIFLLFVFIFALIYLPLSNILPKKITFQILKRDVEIAKYISTEAKGLLLLNDRIALSLLLHDNLNRLEDAQYLFIQGPDGEIISHTFLKGFPRGLLSLSNAPKNTYKVKEFLSRGKRVYDIAVPILKGEIGTLHLGVSLESGKKDIAAITKINYYVAGVILVGLGIGIFVFLIMGFLFSSQIIKLKNFTSKVSRGQLDVEVDIKSKDEIGSLASAFNDMALSLKEKIEEIRRLATVEERSRIAVELHDNLAQNLTHLIAGLEFCEKLFQKDPQRAYIEIGRLKENSRHLLEEARKAIYDLKKDEAQGGYVWLNQISDFINDFQKDKHISVKLDISSSIPEISLSRARMLFYVIKEAFNNIARHSQAKNVEVTLTSNPADNLYIAIKDDGIGFNVEETLNASLSSGRFGLVGMRQRISTIGGELFINSKPQKGTEIFIRIPLRKT